MASSSSLDDAVTQSVKRSFDFFGNDEGFDVSLAHLIPAAKKKNLEVNFDPSESISSSELKLSSRIISSYSHVKDLPQPGQSKKSESSTEYLKRLGSKSSSSGAIQSDTLESSTEIEQTASKLNRQSKESSSTSLVKTSKPSTSALATLGITPPHGTSVPWEDEMPTWHAPWQLMTVLAGHVGWVRCVTVDPTNSWFATGSNDKTIKIWDLAKRELKLTLTGHVATVQSLAASDRHPYLFSAGNDRQVFCWDLEANKNIRNYFGHRAAVFTVAVHPELDLLITGSRDRTVCVWDMRSRTAVHTFAGHDAAVWSVFAQAAEPQVVSGSADSTIRFWDLVAGKCKTTLTNHSKGVRKVLNHPSEYTMVSAGADNLKRWKFPDGNFINNFENHSGIVNSLAINHENVLVSASDNGTLAFWDWRTAHKFYETITIAQPGSVASETGIFDVAFDKTGSRLITCEADKSIKIWREVPNATPETHPLTWKPKRHKVQW